MDHRNDPPQLSLVFIINLFLQDPLVFVVKTLLFIDVCALFLGIIDPARGTATAVALYEIQKLLQE